LLAFVVEDEERECWEAVLWDADTEEGDAAEGVVCRLRGAIVVVCYSRVEGTGRE
jgi:hypothetical protein